MRDKKTDVQTFEITGVRPDLRDIPFATVETDGSVRWHSFVEIEEDALRARDRKDPGKNK